MVRPWDWDSAAAPPPVIIAICVAISGAPVVLTGFLLTKMVLFGALTSELGVCGGAGWNPAIVAGALCSSNDAEDAVSAIDNFEAFLRCAEIGRAHV